MYNFFGIGENLKLHLSENYFIGSDAEFTRGFMGKPNVAVGNVSDEVGVRGANFRR